MLASRPVSICKYSGFSCMHFDPFGRCGVVGFCGVVGCTLAFESQERLFSHYSATAISKLRSLPKVPLTLVICQVTPSFTCCSPSLSYIFAFREDEPSSSVPVLHCRGHAGRREISYRGLSRSWCDAVFVIRKFNFNLTYFIFQCVYSAYDKRS